MLTERARGGEVVMDGEFEEEIEMMMMAAGGEGVGMKDGLVI